MKKISVWAKQHPWGARASIFLSYILLGCIALFLGFALSDSGFSLSSSFTYITCIVFLTGCIFYPSKKDKHRYKKFYVVQKRSDLLLITTSFLLALSCSNYYTQPVARASPFNAVYVLASVTPYSNKTEIDKPVPKKKEIKDLKQKLKNNLRILRKEYKDATPGERTALVILTVIIAIGLLLLVAGLACNLSCSGSGGGAAAVGILGTGLIIFLLVRVIKRINRGKPTKENTEPELSNS